jgi:hypothetical protein
MLVLVAVMALPVGARAAEADTMSVTGRITDQSGCTISFSNGGAIHYGLITAASLNQSSEKKLPEKSVTANLVCTGPTWMAMTIADVRPNAASHGDYDRFGLGVTRTGNPIGYYYVQTIADQLPPAIVDGVTRRFGQDSYTPSIGGAMSRPAGADTWPKGYYRSFIDNAYFIIPFTTAQFEVAAWAYVRSRDALQLVGAERIDGQFVIDIYYM